MQDARGPDKSPGDARRPAIGAILRPVSAPRPDPDALSATLQRLRRSALIAVALFALGIGLFAFASGSELSAEVDRRITFSALALAGASILTRRSLPRPGSSRSFVAMQVASVLCAVGLGLLGALLAVRAGQWQVGALYNVAAALLLLRPPARFEVAPRRRVD